MLQCYIVLILYFLCHTAKHIYLLPNLFNLLSHYLIISLTHSSKGQKLEANSQLIKYMFGFNRRIDFVHDIEKIIAFFFR